MSLIAVHAARAREIENERVERETGFDGGARLIKSTKLGERCAQRKMWIRIVSVGLDRPAKPCHCLLPAAEAVLRVPRVTHPSVSHRVARAEAQGLGNVRLCFFGRARLKSSQSR